MVEQRVAEFNGTVPEQAKILVITKIILNIMKQSDH
jgi:hypothetical protein